MAGLFDGYAPDLTQQNADYSNGGFPSPASFANSNGFIDTYNANRAPSLFNNPGQYFGSFTNSPDISFGNVVQGATRFLPPGLSQATSGLLGLFGVGTHDTGNPLINNFLQPSFGIGTDNLSHIPSNSAVWNDRGATGMDLSIFGEQPQASLFAQHAISASPNIERDAVSAAERSLMNSAGYYDPNGGGWKSGPAPADAQTGYKNIGPINNAGGSSALGWQPWYAGQPDPFDLTGNMLDRPWAGDFGGGRFAYGDGLASSIGGGMAMNSGPGLGIETMGWGPMARFSSDPFGTD